MSDLMQIDAKIKTFVNAGTGSLAQHTFVSDDLKRRQLDTQAFGFKGVAEIEGDLEQNVYYRMNQTGNIYYATTSPELQAATKKLFDSVTVLFAAMTKALAGKGKTLFDYDTWSAIIRKCGYFVEVQKLQKTIKIESGSVTINTQVVQQLLPGLKSGTSMDIAKDVLNALNGTYSASGVTATTKLGHLLFICEELFGAPSVTVRLFYASKTSHQKLTSSPCHKSATESFEQLQEANTFLFVSPDTIAEFSKNYSSYPEEYKNLVDKLAGYIS